MIGQSSKTPPPTPEGRTTPLEGGQPGASSGSGVRPLRLALAGGGTGGHLVPGLHVLAAAPEGAIDHVLWLTGGRAIEERVLSVLPERTTAPSSVESLPVERAGGGAPGWGRLSLRMPQAILRARAALARSGSEVLLGLGGHASIPAVLAARSLGIPVALLEINASAGRANRVLARVARRVFHAWPETVGSGPKHLRLGPPVGPEFDRARAPWPDVARQKLGFPPDRPLLLVLGGSQGAGGLNTFIRDHAKNLLGSGICVLHQVGPGRADEAASALEGYRAVEYLDDVPLALAGATLVLARGGASTLSEIAAMGAPAWIVPYPHHADRHQERNARQLGGGVRIVDEADLGSQVASELVEAVGTEGAGERERMTGALQGAVPGDASSRVLDELLALRRGS